MSKRILSLVLAMVMVLGTFGTVFAANTVTTEAEAGAFLKAAGVLVGDENGNLNLGNNLSRQDAVILVAQLRGEIEAAKNFSKLPTYEDVKIKFYNAPLAWAQDNELFVGHSDKVFGFGENLTAQAYAKVLLTALGYKVAPNGDSDIKWADALAKSEEFGILENLEVSDSTEITRGQMALMTFNALGVTMKDSKETLADKLGIEMPVVEAKELKVEEVYTENLAEVVVELSNAKLVDEEKLTDSNNYKLTGFVVEKATLEGNDVTLLLNTKDGKEALVKGRDYELVIRGIDKAINKTFKFKANDNTIPAIEEVTVLGEYGIKVTTTEPVANVKERNFLIDGKNIAMEVEQYGRDIILTPYHKASFDLKAEKLTVKELVDFAGYKSVEKDFEIEIAKDDVAPKVVDVILRGNKVEVIFDKDIYNGSVDAYYSRVSVGNVSYESGRHSVYADKAEKTDTNKVVYTFEKELPRRTDITIVDVENHSKVAMEKTTMEAREIIDNIEPELIDNKVTTSAADKTATIKLYFNKDVKGTFEDKSDDEFVIDDHFTLYVKEVSNRNIEKYKIDSAKYEEDRKDVVVVKLSGLDVNNKDKDYNYILEVVNFVDASSSRNKMYRDYVDFEVKSATTAFKVEDVYVSSQTKAKTEITIAFNKAVDRTLAEDPTNYIFKHENGARQDVRDLKGEIITERNGKDVTLVLPEFNIDKYDELRILDTLKDKDGTRLNATVTHLFGVNFAGLVEKAENAESDAFKLLNDDADTETTNEVALRKAYNTLVELQEDGKYEKANHGKLVDAIAAVEKAIEKVEKDNEAKKEKEEKDNKAEATKVEKTINALPAVAKLTLKDADKVVAARKAYNDLTEVQKALVSSKVLEALKAAEDKIAELEDADADAKIAAEKGKLTAKINEAYIELGKGAEKSEVAKTTLNDAIVAAETVLATEDVKLEDLTQAIATLNDAIEAFKIAE
ncbi:hypothetical protein [Tissierella pigra]|uniref:Uncharacterized protein n=1 Tax=Tissierella pigra TaxID=2607614 RepID=A0A6N7XXV6_9FIRM|nr:hypothetical protein [Tissierella pigra]MSU00620.1 hypothetical protein [Tissierella pigra]